MVVPFCDLIVLTISKSFASRSLLLWMADSMLFWNLKSGFNGVGHGRLFTFVTFWMNDGSSCGCGPSKMERGCILGFYVCCL